MSAKIRIGGMDVVASGSFILLKDEDAEIFPFTGQSENECLIIKIIIDETQRLPHTTPEVIDEKIVVTLRRPWARSNMSANFDIRFSLNDAPGDFELRFTARLAGTPQDYIVLLNYTIVQESADG